MAVEEIPKSFRYTCDVCGETHTQENANGHYTNGTPPKWAKLVFKRDAVDFQGYAVADGTVERLLCHSCNPAILDAINVAAGKLAAAAEAARGTVKRAGGKS